MINEDFIIQFTGNPATVSNGRSLAGKQRFSALAETEDGSLIFGDCAGSGTTPYRCSVDFSDAGKPVARCTCPSRQIPCKHTVGLLYCKLQGQPFALQALPEDRAGKRAQISKRAEEKGGKDETQRTAKMARSAKAKQCRSQLEGIALAEKMLHNLMLSGLHSVNAQSRKAYGEQARELGNYYIPGIQAAFIELLIAAEAAQAAQHFSTALEAANYLHALLKKSRAHTEAKAAYVSGESAEMPDEVRDAMLQSRIEEQMGYAWKLAELREERLFVRNARLVQVAFSVFEDEAKDESVDEGLWLELTTGALYRSANFRPHKAQKYLKADDSFFSLLLVDELFVYPGDRNPRVRWEKAETRELTSADMQDARKHGEADFAAVVKAVKNQIKNPLSDKNPVFALKMGQLCTDMDGVLYAVDEKDHRIPLEVEDAGFLMKHLSREQAEGSLLVCRFSLPAGVLSAMPLALVTADAILRLQ
jgi:hypothetical protein